MPQDFDEKRQSRRNAKRIFPMASQSLGILFLAGTLALAVNLLRPAGLPFQHQTAPKAQLETVLGEKIWIAVEEAEPLFARKKALFIDARPPDLYEQGHISGSRNLPADAFESSFEKLRREFSQETVVIVYCDGRASERSVALAGELILRGYRNVRVLEKGWDLWVAQELPVEMGEKPDSGKDKGTS